MEKSIAWAKLIALLALAMFLILSMVLLLSTLFPSAEPGRNGVSRLVDTDYGVICYYGRFFASCIPLPK